MRGLLRALEVRRIHGRVRVQGVSAQGIVGDSVGERLSELLGDQRLLDALAISFLGETGIFQGALPGIVAGVVGLHLIDVLINFAVLDSNALVSGTLLGQSLINIGIDHLTANRFGGHAALSEELAPGILIFKTVVCANCFN